MLNNKKSPSMQGLFLLNNFLMKECLEGLFLSILIMRGQQTIKALFPNAIRTTPKRSSKGVYTFDRDVCICYRYYFHYEVLRVRHDDVLSYLEKEFFISATTIMDRLTDNADLLKDIVNNKPNKNSLKRKYPHFSWN